MTVLSVDKDPTALTMTITSRFAAPPDRVWQVWADPRKLERWWGPPTHPATVEAHDLTPGGTVSYFMTGPEGDIHRGWWRIDEVRGPELLVFTDGFADDDGRAAEDLPTTQTRVEIVPREGGGTTMTMTSTFPSADALQQMLDMGVEQGITGAINQIDDILLQQAPVQPS